MFNKLIPPSVPKVIRILAYATFIFFVMIGMLVSLRTLRASFFIFLVNLLFFLVLGALMAAGIIFLALWIIGLGSKNAEAHMDTLFQRKGWCRELWETSDRSYPFPKPEDTLRQLFCRVMGEDYEGAAKLSNKIIADDLSMRGLAMLITCRMQMYAMTDRMDMSHKLFERYRLRMETAYANQPELDKTTHAYADDALLFGKLAAALCIQNGKYADAEKFAHIAEFRLSAATPAAAQFYPLLMQTEQLYAEKKLSDGDSAAQTLVSMVERGEIACSPGEKENFLRAVSQARLFAHYDSEGSSEMTERKLPQLSEKSDADSGLASL